MTNEIRAVCRHDSEAAALDVVPGAEDLVADVILLGEVHGTVEVPTVFASLVRQAATGNGRVLVALEIPAVLQADIDGFLASRGQPGDFSALMRDPQGQFWRRDLQDGRSSAAMIGLLEDLRRMKCNGTEIEVVLVDCVSCCGFNQRDALLAANLVSAVTRHRPARTFMLAGNVHTRTVIGAPWDDQAIPMGAHLAPEFPDLVALDFLALSGKAWTCTGTAPCGPQAMASVMPEGMRPGIGLFPHRSPQTGHDGMLILERVTASPPAIVDGHGTDWDNAGTSE